MAFIKSLIISMAITCVWYFTEYQQFGELQWDRQCDNIVGVLYFIALWYAFAQVNKREEKIKEFEQKEQMRLLPVT